MLITFIAKNFRYCPHFQARQIPKNYLLFLHSQAGSAHKYTVRLLSQHILMPEATITLIEF